MSFVELLDARDPSPVDSSGTGSVPEASSHAPNPKRGTLKQLEPAMETGDVDPAEILRRRYRAQMDAVVTSIDPYLTGHLKELYGDSERYFDLVAQHGGVNGFASSSELYTAMLHVIAGSLLKDPIRADVNGEVLIPRVDVTKATQLIHDVVDRVMRSGSRFLTKWIQELENLSM